MGSGPGMSVLFDVFVVAQRTSQLLAEAMQDSPLSPEEYAIYSGVFAYAPLSNSELARRLGMPVTTMHGHVHDLLSKGDAERRPDPRDARAQLLRLTPQGEDRLRAAAVHFTRVEPLLHQALRRSPDDVRDALDALGTACQQVTTALQLGEVAA